MQKLIFHHIIIFYLILMKMEMLMIRKKTRNWQENLARMVLPLNSYTQWYWKIDLTQFNAFLALRFDDHAQYEIRVYAKIMLEICEKMGSS